MSPNSTFLLFFTFSFLFFPFVGPCFKIQILRRRIRHLARLNSERVLALCMLARWFVSPELRTGDCK